MRYRAECRGRLYGGCVSVPPLFYARCFTPVTENPINTYKDLDFLPPAVVYYYGEWK